MSAAVDPDISANPIQIGLFRPQTVVLHPQSAPNFIEQPGPWRGRSWIAYDREIFRSRH